MRRVTRVDAVQSNNVPVKSQGSLTDEQYLRPRRRSRLRTVDRGAGELQQLSIGLFILAPIEALRSPMPTAHKQVSLVPLAAFLGTAELRLRSPVPLEAPAWKPTVSVRCDRC